MFATRRAWGAGRALAVRSRPAPSQSTTFLSSIPSRRCYADEKASKVPESSQQPKRGEISASGPVPDEAASPIDALGDEKLYEILYGGRIAPKDGEPGLTEAQEESLYNTGRIPVPEEAEAIAASAELEAQALPEAQQQLTHKFALPARPYAPDHHHKKRYHPVIDLLVRMIMKDGKLSVAQRHLATAMNVLRTSPAPIYSPKFPLLPGTPPASHLPLNPVLYLTVAVDSVAPLLIIKQIAGGAGGGRALEVPHPTSIRLRRRLAFQWILSAVEKRPSKGSGRKQFGHRLAEEIVAVVEGRSGVWDKRKAVHKQGTMARVNVGGGAKKNTKRR